MNFLSLARSLGVLHAIMAMATSVHASNEIHGSDSQISESGLHDIDDDDGSVHSKRHGVLDASLIGSMDSILGGQTAMEFSGTRDESPMPLSGFGALKGQLRPERGENKNSRILDDQRQKKNKRNSAKSTKNGRAHNKGKKQKKQKKKTKNKNNKKQSKSKNDPTVNRNCLTTKILYRTCLKRTVGGSLSNTIVRDFRKPYVARNEEIFSGTIYLSLLQDNTKVNCNTIRQIEEFTLRYLADNIGGKLFEPVCVQVTENAYERQAASRSDAQSPSRKPPKKPNRKRGEKSKRNPSEKSKRKKKKKIVESNVLRLKVSYIQKSGRVGRDKVLDGKHEEETGDDRAETRTKGNELEDDIEPENSGRTLRSSKCTLHMRAQCCSQNIINNKRRGQYCSSLGCNRRSCGSGQRHGPSSSLNGKDFNRALQGHTRFHPQESDAHLAVFDKDDVAACSANRYSVESFRTPTIECNRFGSVADCKRNDDLLPKLTEENGGCIEGSHSNGHMMPTMFPTTTPTISPSVQPTVAPSLAPSPTPTINPTIEPTIEPTEPLSRTPSLHPTIAPSILPTTNPTTIPTVVPTIGPSISPTATPSVDPTIAPSPAPTIIPTVNPTMVPTIDPTIIPTSGD